MNLIKNFTLFLKEQVFKNIIKFLKLEKNSFFGKISLLINIPQTTTVISKTNITLINLEKLEFLIIFNLQDDSIKLNNFYFYSVSLVHNNTFIYTFKSLLKQNANLNKRFAGKLYLI